MSENIGTSLQLADLSSPLGSIDAYIQRANAVPLLTQEREIELAERLRDHNDLNAARELVLSHMRFVIRIARGYSGYGLPVNDLIQEGNVGLMKAVKRFDPTMGVRLVSFAVHWVKSEIHEYILRNWRIVKIATTKAQRKLFFNLRKYKKRLGWFSQAEIQSVADDLGVSIQEVELMEERLNAFDAAFDAPNDEADEGMIVAPSQYLEAVNADPAELVEAEEAQSKGKHGLLTALQDLDSRSQDILEQRWLSESKATLHDLAAKYNISAERVRQLENNALKKLKGVIENAA